ncbi:MAG: LysR family transcriptional regulator [Solirubrobacteraceae bacterium]|nr:LysR family transcriptional regulator [Solirubrobacteraceae bacterium]
MDLRALRTLVAVVDERSFSAAADELGYTQSAVSQQIASLERELGVALLSRRPVAPTPAGEALVEQARELSARAEAAAAQARRTAAAGVDERPARIAMSPAAESVLGGVACSGAAGWSTLDVLPAGDAVAALVRGHADLAVVDGVTAPADPLPLDRPLGLTVDLLAETAVDVLLPQDHPLARRAALTLDHLDHARWLIAPACGISADALEAVVRRPLRRGLAYGGSSTTTYCGLIASGAGLGAVPAGAPHGAGVVAVRLDGPQLTHRVELWRHSHDREPVTRAASRLVRAATERAGLAPGPS